MLLCKRKFAIIKVRKGVGIKQEKNNIGIIVSLVIIIVILLALMVLLATGTINFNSKAVENGSNQTNNGETIKNLTEAQAITTVKNVFTNDNGSWKITSYESTQM